MDFIQNKTSTITFYHLRRKFLKVYAMRNRISSLVRDLRDVFTRYFGSLATQKLLSINGSGARDESSCHLCPFLLIILLMSSTSVMLQICIISSYIVPRDSMQKNSYFNYQMKKIKFSPFSMSDKFYLFNAHDSLILFKYNNKIM